MKVGDFCFLLRYQAVCDILCHFKKKKKRGRAAGKCLLLFHFFFWRLLLKWLLIYFASTRLQRRWHILGPIKILCWHEFRIHPLCRTRTLPSLSQNHLSKPVPRCIFYVNSSGWCFFWRLAVFCAAHQQMHYSWGPDAHLSPYRHINATAAVWRVILNREQKPCVLMNGENPAAFTEGLKENPRPAVQSG